MIIKSENILAYLMSNGLRIVIILVASFLSYFVIKVAIDRALKVIKKDKTLSVDEAAKRAYTLGGVLKGLVKIIIFVVALTMILREIGINPTPLLAGAGIAGVALGFGARALVQDLISGFFIIFENQYSVGDTIQIGDNQGVVEQITLRTTRLRDTEGKLHIIPNGEIKSVINFSKKWARSLVDVNISYEEDTQKVISIIEDELEKMYAEKEFKNLFIDMPKVLGVEELGPSSIVIRVAAKSHPTKKEEAARKMRLRIKTRLDKEKIKIPT